jgi:hypothetical protein
MFRIPIAASAAFHGADRVFDLVALLALLSGSLFFAGHTIAPGARETPVPFGGREYTFDGMIRSLERGTLVLFGIGILGIAAVSLFPERLKALTRRAFGIFGDRWAERATGLVDHIHGGVQVFRTPRDMLLCAFWTFPIWWMVILNVQILSGIFGVDLDWAQAGLIVVLVGVAVGLPQAPGYVGPFQFAFSMILVLCFEVEKAEAVAIAWCAWFFQIFPIILIGFVGMSIEGLSLRSFSEARKSIEEEAIPGP